MASDDNTQRPYFRQQSTEDCPQLLQSIQDLYKLLKVTNENTFKFGPITYKLEFMDYMKPASLSEKSSLHNTSNLTTVQEESRLLIASDQDETGDQI